MKKQIITIIISLFFTINFNLTAQTYSGGSGTEADPYLISTRADLATLATTVNGGNNYSGKYFLLTQNLTNISTIIGSSNYFSGVFDGGGYGLTLNINVNVAGNAMTGAFGHIYGASIKNLSVAGTIISAGKVSYAGGIGGYVGNSTIYNCYNTANITSSSSNGDNYVSASSYSGGICGYSSGCTISNCYNIGNLQSNVNSSYYVGSCYSGGICGTSDKITSCFAANTNITTTSNGNTIGFGRISGDLNCTVELCYALSTMQLNSSTVNSQSPSSYQGANATMSDFQSQVWIEDNLFFWDFINTWYIPASISALPVLKKEPFLQFILTPANIIYGDNQQMTLAATSRNTTEPIVFKSSDNTIAKVTGNSLQIIKAGTVTITASQAGLYEYKKDSVTQTLTIAKKELIIKADDFSMIYGDNPPHFTASYSGFVLGETQNNLRTLPQFNCGATSTSNVGKYSITPSGTLSDNYSFTYQAGLLTIQKRALSVVPNNASRQYGTNNPTFTFSYTGFVNGNTENNISVKPIAKTTATIYSDVLGYPITCSGGSATNYEFTSYETGVLTITKAPLTIKANNATRPIGQPNPTFTMSYSGFKNSDDFSVLDNLPAISCSVNESSPAGNYDIVLSGGSDNNYSFTLTNGILTVIATNAVESVYNKKIKIYPNPVKNELQIESEELTIKKIEIVNLSGEIKNFQFNNLKKQINVSALPKGIYFMKLQTDKDIVIKKIIKE